MACVAVWHGAGGAGVGVGCGGGDAVLLQKLGNAFFDAIVLLDSYAAGEVLDGVEEATLFDDGDSDRVEVGVEEIGAVGGSGHPDFLEVCGTFAVAADVLGDGGEVGSGVGSAGLEVGLSGVLMEIFALILDYALEVGVGGVGEGAVPVQRREVVGGSGLVG